MAKISVKVIIPGMVNYNNMLYSNYQVLEIEDKYFDSKIFEKVEQPPKAKRNTKKKEED